MASAKIITRRAAILGGAAGAGLLIANSDTLTLGSDFAAVSHAVEDWTKTAQRGLLFPDRLAREQPVGRLHRQPGERTCQGGDRGRWRQRGRTRPRHRHHPRLNRLS